MPTIKFSLNNEYYEKLEKAAAKKGMNIQDYVRYKLFDMNSIFTIEEAIRRIQEGDFKDKVFSLPEVYGDEWTTLERGLAGVFGKNFYLYTQDHPELKIVDKGYDKKTRREIYTYEGGRNE